MWAWPSSRCSRAARPDAELPQLSDTRPRSATCSPAPWPFRGPRRGKRCEGPGTRSRLAATVTVIKTLVRRVLHVLGFRGWHIGRYLLVRPAPDPADPVAARQPLQPYLFECSL